jgi:hypothetical protein
VFVYGKGELEEEGARIDGRGVDFLFTPAKLICVGTHGVLIILLPHASDKVREEGDKGTGAQGIGLFSAIKCSGGIDDMLLKDALLPGSGTGEEGDVVVVEEIGKEREESYLNIGTLLVRSNLITLSYYHKNYTSYCFIRCNLSHPKIGGVQDVMSLS